VKARPPGLFALYALVSVLGAAAFYRTRKLAISVHNLIRGRAIRQDLFGLHKLIDEAVTNAH